MEANDTALALPRVDPNYEDARRKTVGPEAAVLTSVTYLGVALGVTLLLLGIVSVANYKMAYEVSHRKLPVIYVQQTGRADVSMSGVVDYTPQEGETRHYLAEFVEGFYGRRRATIRESYPNSLKFLEQRKAEELMGVENRDHWIEAFVVNNEPEVSITIRGVIFQNIKTSPYRAVVEFDKNFLTEDSVVNRETWYATITFDVNTAAVLKDPSMELINPLGFAVTDLRQDHTFVPAN